MKRGKQHQWRFVCLRGEQPGTLYRPHGRIQLGNKHCGTETNTVEPNDCLSKIAADCNAKYGTDYTADDLQSLNPHIENKDLIYAGDRLNLGKAEEVQSRAKDYIGRATTQYAINEYNSEAKSLENLVE